MNQLVEVIKVMAPPGKRRIHRARLGRALELWNCGSRAFGGPRNHGSKVVPSYFQGEYFGAQLRDAHPTVGVCYVAF